MVIQLSLKMRLLDVRVNTGPLKPKVATKNRRIGDYVKRKGFNLKYRVVFSCPEQL